MRDPDPTPPPRPREDLLSRGAIRPRQFRATTRLPVVTAAPTGARIYYTKNLSIGGLFLLTDNRWHIGTSVDLTVRFDDVEHHVAARVTHMQSDGVGMSFISPPKELQRELRSVLSAHVDPIEMEAFGSLKKTMFRKVRERMRVSWSHEALRFAAVLRELSDDGLFLDTDEVPAFGAEIYVHLPVLTTDSAELTTSELRGARAKVIFRDSSQFGATFINPSAEFRMAVRGLLQK